MEEEGINSEAYNKDDLIKVEGPHMNILDVEFKPVSSLPMEEVVIPFRLKHGCYQELSFLGKTFEMQLN